MNHSGLSPPDFSAIKNVHEEYEDNSKQVEVLQLVPPEPNWKMSPLLNLSSPYILARRR